MVDVLDENEYDELIEGLAILGWTADIRVSSEETIALLNIAREAQAAINRIPRASEEELERLAEEAYNILEFPVSNVDERSMMVTGPYSEATRLKHLIPLIDEATLAFYRGYHTAAFATLLISLEAYLRNVTGWLPGAPDPTFRQLTNAVENFAPSRHRDHAFKVIQGLYGRYDTTSPTLFYFNRHGLMHGLRNPKAVDRLNCCRMFILFDYLAWAELGHGNRSVIITDEFTLRHNAYQQCVFYGREKELMKRT